MMLSMVAEFRMGSMRFDDLTDEVCYLWCLTLG